MYPKSSPDADPQILQRGDGEEFHGARAEAPSNTKPAEVVTPPGRGTDVLKVDMPTSGIVPSRQEDNGLPPVRICGINKVGFQGRFWAERIPEAHAPLAP